MKRSILLRTNFLICFIVIAGFLLTALLSYRANYSMSLTNIEQVSDLTSQGIYHQITTTFAKPVNVSLTMANDSLLKDLLQQEAAHAKEPEYLHTIQAYLAGYQKKYQYDSVFLVSNSTLRYYNYNGLDRVLDTEDPEDTWYFSLLEQGDEYSMNVDNDEVAGVQNRITVFVNCKITDESNHVLGIVGVGVRIDSLQQLLKGYQEQYHVNAYLTDQSGIIQVSSEYSGYERIDLFSLEDFSHTSRTGILNWQEEGEANTFWASNQTDHRQMNYIVTRYIPELEWHLVVERNTGTLLKNLHRQLAFVVFVITVILAIILFIITHVIRNFNRRIVALMEVAKKAEDERHSLFQYATEQLFENIYELDITNNCPANRATEVYFESLGAPAGIPFDQALQIIARKQIKEEFRQGYIDTFSPDNVLKTYQEGNDTLHYEFMISADGSNYYWMRITAQLVWLESANALHMMVYRQNIDAEKRREGEMRKLAQTDEMTGMLTKAAAQRQGDILLAQGEEQLFALFIFDIDNFKLANDRYGHAFGDEVIRFFTQTIRRHFRKEDLLGRIGGDEFIALVPVSLRPAEPWVRKKAEELSRALDQDFSLDGKTWHVSASIGVALTYGASMDYHRLYQNADRALYKTKERGKNGFTLFQS